MERWFAASNNDTEKLAQDRCHAFLHSLLSTTLLHLEEICKDEAVHQKIQAEPSIRLQILASEFRSRMAKGRTFEAHGDYRRKFYDIVFETAAEASMIQDECA